MGPEPYGLAVRGRTWSRPVMSYDTAHAAVPTLHEQVLILPFVRNMILCMRVLRWRQPDPLLPGFGGTQSSRC